MGKGIPADRVKGSGVCEERHYVVDTVDVVNLFDRNVELKNMTFLNSTFEIEKVGSHFSGIHHGISPAISAANGNSIVD